MGFFSAEPIDGAPHPHLDAHSHLNARLQDGLGDDLGVGGSVDGLRREEATEVGVG